MTEQLMETTFRTALWQQFGAAIHMLENALVACSDSLWRERLWSVPPLHHSADIVWRLTALFSVDGTYDARAEILLKNTSAGNATIKHSIHTGWTLICL